MENLRYRNRGVLSDVFQGSGLASQETPGDASGGAVCRAGSPKNPLDAIVELEKYRPVEGACFGGLRVVAGTR